MLFIFSWHRAEINVWS